MMQRVSLTIDGNGIATVELNRPDKLNALDMPMFKAINKTISHISKDPKVKVVILKGAGEDFCSGLDVKSVLKSSMNALKLLFKWLPFQPNLAQKVSYRWRTLNVPVICVIHGRCWGGGMQIALGADFRIAHPEASLSIMEAKWGLIPDMSGNAPLTQLIPIDLAKRLIMTAEIFTGDEAKEYGLVTEVSKTPEQQARSLALQLLETSPDVLKGCKHLFNRNWHKSEARFLAAETWQQIKIILGKNQSIAVKRASGKDIPFK